MKQPVALLLLILTVLSLASCSMEKRVYSSGYHISWMQPINLDASQGRVEGASQDLPKDLSKNLRRDVTQGRAEGASLELSQNLPKDLSKNLSSNLEIHTLSDTITPNTKEDDYFGQKNYPSEESKTNFKKNNIFRQKDIIQIKKDTKSMFIIAFFSLLISSFSIFLISESSNIGSVNGFKSLIALILFAIFSFGLFIITLPVGIFLLFKLLYLKITKKGISIDSPKASS